jgi:hypothetical protein
MSQFRILFQDKKLTSVSRQIVKEQFDEMAEKGGWWNVSTTQRQYTGGRCKYLFDCVYQTALPNVCNRWLIVDSKTGKQRTIETSDELHLCMKTEFLEITIINRETGEAKKTAGSSTVLEDDKFYMEFEEQVIQLLTEMGGFGDLGCLSRDEWVERKHPKNIENY